MAIKRKPRLVEPEAAPTPNERVAVGGNNPPVGADLDAWRERYATLRKTAEQWQDGIIDSQEEADRLDAFCKQVRAFQKEADAARAAEKKPHDDAAKKVQEKWRPVLDSATRILDAMEAPRKAWLKREQDRINAEREAARKAAEEAAREAERIAERAMRSGTFAAQDAAAEAAAAADEAARKAKEAEKAKASIGGGYTVDGVKRSSVLRTFEKVRCTEVAKAAAFLILSKDVDLTPIADACEQVARQYRKLHPGEDIPGITIEQIERVV